MCCVCGVIVCWVIMFMVNTIVKLLFVEMYVNVDFSRCLCNSEFNWC